MTDAIIKVALGNRDAHIEDTVDAGTKTERREFVPLPKGKRAVQVEGDPTDGATLGSVFGDIVHPKGIWTHHAANGATPAWVASSHPALAQMLADHFGGIEVRDLEDWEPGPPKGGGSARGAAQAPLMMTLLFPLILAVVARLSFHLKTNAGNDFQASQMGGSASATAVAKWVALTANVTAPAAGDTTLTGEITTGGGGLIRKAGTYAHTTGAAAYTITTTFTANGSDSLPVTIGKRGSFDAASGGNMVFETLVSPTATLSASGDQLVVTDTVNL